MINTQDPQNTALASLPQALRALAEQEIMAHKDMNRAYQAIMARAQQGEEISASEMIAADTAFSKKTEGITAQLQIELLREQTEKRLNRPALMALSKQYHEAVTQGANGVENTYPSDKTAQVLRKTFIADKVATAPAEQVVAIDKDTANEAGLLSAVLMKNRGVALADVHTQDEMPEFLIRNMTRLKSLGVDTIYFEGNEKKTQLLNLLSPQELRQLAENREIYGYKLRSPAMNASSYDTKSSDDVWKSYALMFARAKEEGIRMVNIDKVGQTKELLRHKPVRIEETNYIWTHNIEADRQFIKATRGEVGKFVVFGGAAHFVGHGMVDEALSVPVIAFDRRDKQDTKQVTKKPSLTGPDYYLAGGNDYPALDKFTQSSDAGDLAEVMQKGSFLPGMEAAHRAVQTAQTDAYEAFLASSPRRKIAITLSADPATPNAEKTPTATPSVEKPKHREK